MNKPKPFKKFLQKIRPHCAHQLIERANTANRLAKLSFGRSKMMLYSLKYKHLSRAIEILPHSFYIDSLKPLRDRTVLGIRTIAGKGFHVPAEQLSSEAILSFAAAANRRKGGNKR